MKFFFALLATMFFALPAWAVDVQMGYDMNLAFEDFVRRMLKK